MRPVHHMRASLERAAEDALPPGICTARAENGAQPPGIFICSERTILYSNRRFLLAVTRSLVRNGVATRYHMGTIFEVKTALYGSVQAQIECDARGSTHLFLLNVPNSELWRAVVLEEELLAWDVIPAVGSSLPIGSLPTLEETNATILLRRRLAELLLEGKADGLLLTSRNEPQEGP
jgi:hypothetical protein